MASHILDLVMFKHFTLMLALGSAMPLNYWHLVRA